MNQLKIELREPSPDDYRRANKAEEAKNEVVGDIKTSELSEEDVQKLYKRASEIKEKEDDEKDFFKREKSVKPPRKGEIIQQSFPPPVKIEKPEELLKEEAEMMKELKVLRYMPEAKDIETATQVVVSFNQPMVPLTGVDDLKKYPVPVKMNPSVEGEWRWVGTKTVKWKPTYRLPKSTEYTVAVPKGVKSELGCELKEEVSFQFSTIPVRISKFFPQSSYHYNRVGKNGIVFVEFNQKIDPKKIMSMLTVGGGGKQKPRLLSPEEVRKRIDDKGIMKQKRRHLYDSYRRHLRTGMEGRCIWLGFAKPLPLNRSFTVKVEKGCPSMEGPRLTSQALTQTFSTYGPLTKTTHYPQRKIVPNQSWSINFTNNLELDDFDPDRDVTIKPAIPGAEIMPSGSTIRIRGRSKGATNYRVILKKSLTDIYGQKLSKETTVVFQVGRAQQSMYGFFNGQMIVHDMCMNDKPQFEVVTINLDKIRVCVFQVEPWEYHKSGLGEDYYQYEKKWNYRNTTIEKRVNCGKKVFDKVLKVKHTPDELAETIISLSPFLQNKKERCGQLFVYVEPNERSWKKSRFSYAPRIMTWVQVTNLAVDAVASCGGEMYSFATTLKEGRPVEEAEFTYIPPQRCYHPPKEQKDKYHSKIMCVFGDEEGTAFFSRCSSHGSMIVCKKGNDVCFVKGLRYIDRPNGRMLSYIVNDRLLYKPNEIVSVKGIFREMFFETWERKLRIPEADQEVRWICYDPRGSKLKEGTVKTNRFGSFFMEVQLPDNINLGSGRIRFYFKDRSYDHEFKIQEFRTPEFQSKAKVDPGPYFLNQVAIVEGKAEYFSGGGLSGCDVEWNVTQSESSYVPPNFTFNGFNFYCGYQPLKPPTPSAASSGGSSGVVRAVQKFKKKKVMIRKRGKRKRRYSSSSSCSSSSSTSDSEDEGLGSSVEEGKNQLKGKTDGSGFHKMTVEFNEEKEAVIKKPSRVTCRLNIKDINRQVMSTSTSFLVHPSKYYVGIKKNKYFARKGDALPMDVVVTDVNGLLVPDVDIEMTVYNRYWERKGYNWKEFEAKVMETKVKSKEEPFQLDMKLDEGGTYIFVCKVVDGDGNENFTSTRMWVAGGKEKLSGGSKVQREEVKIIGNRKEYKVGDEAKLLVSSPFSPAHGLMVVVCNGFTQKVKFHVEEDSTVLTVPIRREYVPNCHCEVFVVGTGQRVDDATGRPSAAAPSRPAYASGGIFLPVPAKKQTLTVEVEPDRKIMKPGESSEVRIQVSSTDDKFSSSDKSKTAVSLIIVDEAVLSLTGYSLPHPISQFYPGQDTQVSSYFFRSSVVMKDWSSVVVESPPEPKKRKKKKKCCKSKCCCRKRCCCCECKKKKKECCDSDSDESSDCDSDDDDDDDDDDEDTGSDDEEEEDKEKEEEEEEEEEIEVRQDFKPLACFIHDSVTDNEGKIVIPFKLPDNLTRYRVWVLAHHEETQDVFGLGESAIQAQLPVAIRPSLPRFLNYGDLAEFTVVVQNQTLETIQVKVAVRMTNLRLVDASKKGVLVEIPYNRRAELRFPVRTHRSGQGRFQVIGAVVGMKFADAVEKSLPIFTPATSEAFATYGELDGDGTVIQSVKPPESVYNAFGGLTITTSSTALQALTDAFLYLYHYKFDCVEQISSRMLSINALQKFLYEFNVPKMPTKKEIKKVMLHGFKKIRGTMRNDGAIGFWSLLSRVNIYLSIYVAHNLIRCKENGYEVDKTLLDRSKSFCTNVDRYFRQYCSWYSEYSKASLRAFALYVLTIYGVNKELSGHEMDRLAERAQKLYKEKKEYFSHEGKVWLMFCLSVCSREKEKHPIVLEILKWVMNNVEESPETAHFITSYGDDGKLVMLHSNRRTDGVILEVLCHVDKGNYLIPKIVKGLLAHRKKGKWKSTQENVYILMALKKYFEVFENVLPDFLCRVWLGEGYAGEVKFRGREVDYKAITIPMRSLVPDEEEQEGEGEDDPEKHKKDLVIWKQGPGRLYYRLGMDYAPKSSDLKAADYGFQVERTYEGVVKKEHVKKLESGVWSFTPGELIRVKLRLTTISRRFHVALVDFIPAGCEVLNPELKGTQAVPGAAKSLAKSRSNRSPYQWSWWYCYYPWYEHVNLRDERVEAFSSYLYSGTHEYEYIMRATSIGEFVVPPAKAEEMYSPELFGRSSSEKVVIKEE